MTTVLTGKITHYANREGIIFTFNKARDKKKGEDVLDEFEYSGTDIPFEIWKKFRDSKVEITIKKVK